MVARNATLEVNGERMRQTLVLRGERPRALASFDAVGTARDEEFAPIRVGGRIDGYKVESPLAEGGMGGVYRVKDRTGTKSLALKAPLPDGRGGSYSHRMRRFLREVRLASRMNHPGVAKVVEVGQDDGLPYFTMDLVDGAPLSDRLALGPLAIGEALAVVESAARAVHHIHQMGVVHRDLKPQNLLVRDGGDAVVIDFGLARDAAGIDPRITQSGVWLGTPAYISPEQASGGASAVDARTDVYALGAVLYEALTGTPPYGAGSPKSIFRAMKAGKVTPVRELRPEASRAVEAVVLKAIAFDANDRHATALELALDLRRVLRDEARAAQERAPIGLDAPAIHVPLSDPGLTPAPAALRRLDRTEIDEARRFPTPRHAAETIPDEAAWIANGTSDAKHARLDLADPIAAEPRRAPKRSKRPSHTSTEVAPEGRTARLLAIGGPALLAAFGLLLLLV